MDLPRISIVTPNYNSAKYIEQTISSVLGQGYPNLEYIIIDGASDDGSVEIIKKYEDQLAYWHSKKDSGQSNAINTGFQKCTGDIIAWLNSDDMLQPGALAEVAKLMDPSAEEILCGNCLHFWEGTSNAWGSDVKHSFADDDLRIHNFVIQPSTFFTRKTWEKCGGIREDLYFTMDWEYWLRAQKLGVKFKTTDKYLAVYRLHEETKTIGEGGDKRVQEMESIVAEYADARFVGLHTAYSGNQSKVQRIRLWANRFKMKKMEISFIKFFLKEFRRFNNEDIAAFIR